MRRPIFSYPPSIKVILLTPEALQRILNRPKVQLSEKLIKTPSYFLKARFTPFKRGHFPNSGISN
jgi:hypothetical protein